MPELSEEERADLKAKWLARQERVRNRLVRLNLNETDFLALLGGRYRIDPRIVPDDARIDRFYIDQGLNPPGVTFILQSEAYAEVPDGGSIPHVSAWTRATWADGKASFELYPVSAGGVRLADDEPLWQPGG